MAGIKVLHSDVLVVGMVELGPGIKDLVCTEDWYCVFIVVHLGIT